MVVSLSGNTSYFQNKYSDKGITFMQNPNLLEVHKREVITTDKLDVSAKTDCDDGKDDGKIGLVSAAGNVIKGVGNTAVDVVKGCFTDEKGDLSVGKTLLTLGTAAVCIAFPPVGLAACALGTAAGAIKAGSGIYNAVNAKTDKEAKEAWQNVGGGALTAGASLVGARASLGAMKATSSATETGSALEALGENATTLEKASALAKDAVSSSKNNVKSIKDSLKEKKDFYSEIREINKMRKANAQALEKQAKGEALSETELNAIAEWDNIQAKGYSAEALAEASKQNAKAFFEAELKEAKQAGDKDAINAAKQELNKYSTFHNVANSALNTVKQSNTMQAGKGFTSGLENTTGLINKAKLLKANLSKENFAKVYEGLSADGKAILAALNKSNPESVISKYGYENVAAVLKTVSGTMLADNAV